MGFTVFDFSSSIEALAFFREDPSQFRLVITDQTMPDLTGSQLVSEMLKLNPETNIIISTGFSNVLDQDKADALGVKALLMKPYSNNQLVQVIQSVIENKND